MTKPDIRRHMRAEGNLRYLDFIRLVHKLWSDGHPDVPLTPAFTSDYAKYPCIVYEMELRRPVTNEPKPKIREIIEDDGETYVISAQRFQTIVTFTAIDEIQADKYPHGLIGFPAEELIERFEDFMQEFQPVFKRLGASELVYARRIPDSTDDRRNAPAIRKHGVSYIFTEEKIIKTLYAKLSSIEIDARIWLSQEIPEEETATPDITISVTDQHGTSTDDS